MPRVQTLLDAKRQERPEGVLTIQPDASVLDASRLMNDRRVGAVVVVDQESKLLGIFTERDVLTRVVAAEKSPSGTPIASVMTTQVAVCGADTPLDDLRALMRQRHIRHVPVVDQDRVIGMVSIGDLNTAEAQTMSETIRYLERYMYSG